MRTKLFIIMAALFAIAAFACQSNEPWTEKQLMEPADLAKVLNDAKSTKPLVYSIGFAGGIKGSKEMGAARDQVNIDKFREELKSLPKDADVVIYCGCCPFANCPNVRPAFRLLNEMKFTNAKLLNLSHNLKTDWIDKGYPTEQ